MLKRDYILALIEESTRALANILRHQEAREWLETQDAVADSAQSYLGITLTELNQASALDLIALVRTGRDQDIARWHHLIGLLQIQGAIREYEKEEMESINLYFKALDIATEVSLNDDRLPYYLSDIEALQSLVEEYMLPAGIQSKLFHIYEQSDQYAVAEDTLFDMLDQSNNDDEIIELGLDFYDRLLRKSDYKLQSGGLPRHEIEESLAELLTLKQ